MPGSLHRLRGWLRDGLLGTLLVVMLSVALAGALSLLLRPARLFVWELLGHLQALVRGSALGALLVVALSVALLGGLSLLVVTLLNGRRQWLLRGTVAASGVTMAIAAANVALDRAVAFELISSMDSSSSLDPSRGIRLMSEAITRVFETRFFVGHGVMAVLVSIGVALSRSRPLAIPARLGLFGAMAVLVSMGALIVRCRCLVLSTGSPAGVDPAIYSIERVWDAVADANEATYLAKLALAGLAVVGIAWLSVLAIYDARRGYRAPRGALLAASAILGLGLAATVGNRAVAHDARHPVPPVFDGFDCGVNPILVEQLPRGPSGPRFRGSSPSIPVVEVLDGRVSVRQRALSTPAELEAELRDQLARSVRERQSPGVVIGATEDQDVDQLVPWLAAVKRAGYATGYVLFVVSPVVVTETATLGALTRTRCSLKVLDGLPGADLTRQISRWGELTRRASSGG